MAAYKQKSDVPEPLRNRFCDICRRFADDIEAHNREFHSGGLDALSDRQRLERLEKLVEFLTEG